MFEFPKGFELKLRLKDMLEDAVDEKYYLSDELTEKIRYRLGDKEYSLLGGMQKNQSVKEDGISTTLTSSMGTGGGYVPMINEPVRKYGIFDDEKGKHQAGSVWDKEGLAPTLDTMQGGYRQPCIEIREKTKQGYKEAYEGDGVYLNRPHQKRGVVQNGMIQTLKTSCGDVGVVVKTPSILRVGNTKSGGQRSEIISDNGISSCLSATDFKQPKQIYTESNDLRIRKLTPLECFRLMGFDDSDFNKVVGISNTQLYKMAGNSIVVDVLVHLFKNLFEALESKEHKEVVKQPTLFEIDKEVETVMEEVKQEEMIQWDELDDLIGKPVFDKDNDEWRILKGYQRMGNDYSLTFTDTDGDFEDVDLNCTNLFRNEVSA